VIVAIFRGNSKTSCYRQLKNMIDTIVEYIKEFQK